MIRRPNSELVVCAWMNSIAELTRPSNFCATQLPEDNSTWGSSGFTTVTVVGGRRDMDLHAGRPVVKLDIWATQPSGQRPLWGAAFNMAESIIKASEDEPNIRRLLTLTSHGKSYGTARVMETYTLGEPMRVDNDPSAYAHVVMDMRFHWVRLTDG
jgi:hypothetical protein